MVHFFEPHTRHLILPALRGISSSPDMALIAKSFIVDVKCKLGGEGAFADTTIVVFGRNDIVLHLH